MERQRTLRVGLTAILCALILRLFATDLPAKLLNMLRQPETAALITYIETGRNVRFSASLEAFFPDFVESPPAAAKEAPLPYFSDPESIDLYYAVTKQPDIAALLKKPLSWDLRQGSPTVLILHTHATESYTQTGQEYQESSPYRTTEESHNMLSLGAFLGELLQQAGIPAVQDRTLHDYPAYNGSYAAARKTIKKQLEANPGIRLVLDLHRDASSGAGQQMRTKASVDGQSAAQIMLVVGANHGSYEENLSLALKLHAQLEAQCPGITRPLQLRASRFNQDLSPGALIVEVGAAGNTREEALLSLRELAKAIAALAQGTQSLPPSGEGGRA